MLLNSIVFSLHKLYLSDLIFLFKCISNNNGGEVKDAMSRSHFFHYQKKGKENLPKKKKRKENEQFFSNFYKEHIHINIK